MKTEKNIVVRYASGMVGDQLVAREWKGIPYLANAPSYPEDRKFSEKQIAHQERFLDATAYGKQAILKEELLELYAKEAENAPLTPYNVAIRDFLRPPKVRDIDVTGYSGQPGDEIVVRAVDDVEVVGVHVVVINNGDVVEEGDAVRDEFNATLWRYTAQETNGVEGTIVRALAADIPGNVTSGEIEL